MNMILFQESGSKAPGKEGRKSQQSENPTSTRSTAPSKPAQPANAAVMPAPKPQPATADSQIAANDLCDKVIQIFVDESGVPAAELTDETNFADVGVDSLLITIISGRLMEELEIDINSGTFLDELLTVKDLKSWIARKQPDGVEFSSSVQGVATNVDEQREAVVSGPAPELEPQGNGANFDSALKIISEESGVPLDELTGDTNFADVGIDSLLSTLIAGRWQEELSLECDPATVFSEIMTVQGLRNYLAPAPTTIEGPAAPITANKPHTDPTNHAIPVQHDERESGTSSSDEQHSRLTPPTTGNARSISPHHDIAEKLRQVEDSRPSRHPIPDEQVQKTTSVLLQGRPRAGVKNLFLFPDGSGSASSYNNMGRVQGNVALIGLNCPYVRNPEAMTCTLDQMIRSFLDEVRRRQPVGPYSFGGWSAGGILAYRATQELIREGETVGDLLLLDAPEPIGLDKLPQRFIDHLESCGIWAEGRDRTKDKQLSARVAAHFDAIMDLLCDYYADPLPEGHTPKVSILWATECLLDGVRLPKLRPGDDDVEGMKFLSEKRTDFSAGRWASLFPGEDIFIERATGLDHFGMMVGGTSIFHL